MTYFPRQSCALHLMALLIAFLPPAIAQMQPAPETTPKDQIRTEHQRVLDDMNAKDAQGKLMDLDDPRMPELLKRGWGLAGTWAAQYFESNSSPSKSDLQKIFAGFAPASHRGKSPYGDFLEYDAYFFQGSAIQIGSGAYVVEASYGVEFRTSSFMVVARNTDDHFQVLWNIKDLAAQHYEQRDEIGRWMYLVGRAYHNGPLAVHKILRLSPSAQGHARFLVDAYQGADGGTILNQLSIWEWDGKNVQPLLVDVYYDAVDFAGFHFDGTTLRISTKEESQMETLFSCGMCGEPRGIWTLRIGPDGVHDLGHRLLKPEFKWADELLTTLDKGGDAKKLAAPRVVSALKARMSDVEAEDVQLGASATGAKDFSWGMLGQCRVLRRGEHGAFVLVVDEGKLHFSYVLRKGKPYFTTFGFNELSSGLNRTTRPQWTDRGSFPSWFSDNL